MHTSHNLRKWLSAMLGDVGVLVSSLALWIVGTWLKKAALSICFINFNDRTTVIIISLTARLPQNSLNVPGRVVQSSENWWLYRLRTASCKHIFESLFDVDRKKLWSAAKNVMVLSTVDSMLNLFTINGSV